MGMPSKRTRAGSGRLIPGEYLKTRPRACGTGTVRKVAASQKSTSPYPAR